MSDSDDIADILDSPKPQKKELRKSVTFNATVDIKTADPDSPNIDEPKPVAPKQDNLLDSKQEPQKQSSLIFDDEEDSLHLLKKPRKESLSGGNKLQKAPVAVVFSDDDDPLLSSPRQTNVKLSDSRRESSFAFSDEDDPVASTSHIAIAAKAAKLLRPSAVSFDDDGDDNLLATPRQDKLPSKNQKKSLDFIFNEKDAKDELRPKQKPTFSLSTSLSASRPSTADENTNRQSDSDNDFGGYKPSATEGKKKSNISKPKELKKQKIKGTEKLPDRPKTAPTKKSVLDVDDDIFSVGIGNVSLKPKVEVTPEPITAPSQSGYVSKYETADISDLFSPTPPKIDGLDSNQLNSSFTAGGGRRRSRTIDDLFTTSPKPSQQPATNEVAQSISSAPSLTSTAEIAYENKIKKLEMEKEHLKEIQEMQIKKNKDEISFMEDSHRQKIAMLEDAAKRREERLMEEIQLLTKQSSSRLREFDDERKMMRGEFQTRLDEAGRDKRTEIEKLSEKHRADVEALRVSSGHAENLRQLVDKVSSLCDRLGNLGDRDAALRLREQSVEQFDGRALQSTLHKLEDRLTQQSRAETALTDLVAQLMEERRCLALERAELKSVKSSESTKALEHEASKRAIEDDRRHLADLETRLREEKTLLFRERAAVTEENERLKRLNDKLKTEELHLKERIERAERLESRGKEALSRSEVLEQEQKKRLLQIQSELAELRTKERKVADEKARLAEERNSLEQRAASSLLCSNCRVPVRDSGIRVSASTDSLHLARLKVESERDWEFLEEEKNYLDNIKTNVSFNNYSTSFR